MKRSLFILSLFTLLYSTAGAQGTDKPRAAEDVLMDACRQAAREQKNVFVIFHASWCIWCRRMDTSMNDPSCKKFFQDNYVVVHLVTDESDKKKHLENPGGAEMKDRYHGKEKGLPYWVVLDNKASLLADSRMPGDDNTPGAGANTGCPAAENEVNYFISVLKKTSSLDEAALEIIRVRFRKNDL
ncbi:MAG: thioredoxin family protein [Chitinophagaceae bacterium]|nr:thioredoxin family protein [Chitinophagaceae bacterium]